MKVKEKLFVVTGAAGGIGSEIVKLLLSKGARVAACDINESELAKLPQSPGLVTYVLDITDLKAVNSLPSAVMEKQGEVDGLINTAGIIQPFVRVNDIDYEHIYRVMNVNFYGTLFMVKAFLPFLLKRPEAHIVNISSMGGFLPVPGQAVYGASKAAVKLLSESLYAELRNTNVRVTVVFPGATRTRITEHSNVEIPEAERKSSKIPTMDPKVVARLIIEGVEQDRFQIFTGRDSKTMNLLYRLNPKFAVDYIARQMGSLLK